MLMPKAPQAFSANTRAYAEARALEQMSEFLSPVIGIDATY